MITMTITNASSTAAIGAGTSTPLPSIFNWASIAASGNKAYVIRLADLAQPEGGKDSGLTVGDALQHMVNRGLITVASANLAATLKADVMGDAAAAET